MDLKCFFWRVTLCLIAMGGRGQAQTMRVPIYRPDTAPRHAGAGLTALRPLPEKRCWLFPARFDCMNYGSGVSANVNAFYGMAGPAAWFSQIQSAYNGASAGATISADLATLNFTDGMQVTLGANMQAGSPTGANRMALAAQNMLSGGTESVSALYPVMAVGADKLGSAGGFGMTLDVAAKEGFDLQNFTAGSDANANSPPSHASAQMEGYVQYNSANLASDSDNFAGALFVGGSWGYSYTSHQYARDYGFGNRVSNRIGQISAGVLINGVARITISRAFGPSQAYIDGATMAQTRVNNFRAWSVGITYQAPAPAPK